MSRRGASARHGGVHARGGGACAQGGAYARGGGGWRHGGDRAVRAHDMAGTSRKRKRAFSSLR
jgi:hypothetical protein